MNVLSFSYCFPHARAPAWGVFVERRLAALARRPGVELQVVAPVPSFPLVTRWRRGSVPAQEQWNGLTVHRPRFFSVPGVLKSLDAKFYARGLRRQMEAGSWRLGDGERWRPDVLDAHFIWPDGVAVALLARRLGIPYVITLRGLLWVSFLHPRIKKQSIEAMKHASAVISLSKSMVDVCCELGVPHEKFTVIHNGVDRSVFSIGDKEEARRRLGLPIDKKLIVCVAYYQRRKGLLELIRALASLPSDVHLVLVGSKIAQERRFYRRVFLEIERLGLASRVRHEGQQPHERIAQYFQAGDVTALPSYWEGCPNAVVESLACGTPVVATPVGAVPDMVVPGRNGEIVPPRDSEALAAALSQALERYWNPEDVRRGVKSWDEVAEQVHQVLDAACQPGCREFDNYRTFQTWRAEFSAE